MIRFHNIMPDMHRFRQGVGIGRHAHSCAQAYGENIMGVKRAPKFTLINEV